MVFVGASSPTSFLVLLTTLFDRGADIEAMESTMKSPLLVTLGTNTFPPSYRRSRQLLVVSWGGDESCA
jgi:hypothetical protein